MIAASTNFFADCHSSKDARRRYRELVLEHHPDRGGDADTMRTVIEQYKAFVPTANDVLSDEALARRMNETSTVHPRDYREFVSRPNLTEWFDSDKGRYVIGTLEQHREYLNRPHKETMFQRLFGNVVADSEIA